ncbi:Ion transporter channel, putative [Trypanosoma brucei gambiense DAL972]|uniref:Ion transporter channel, putative n=1 Tax=Trypanosoma brucei gambiense (strain MHOM/CI/86/DAL972) TaxID=679716 RepID=C9ZI17_TRYB9|nr:Ion transporter channel, putative [Trypanosoma brucei gambiense DAL972]CBH09134.1 Ion transporter channel, putative [Trypanosoma brucei gambiense DAL972]|eukprot:XP_011771575.1 Ion transporter channel, putative [Trypanosoma brucei gambiense DAL972]
MYTLYPRFDAQPSDPALLGEAAGNELLKEVTDLTSKGHRMDVGEYIPFRRSLRFNTPQSRRPARRRRGLQDTAPEYESEGSSGFCSDVLATFASQLRCLFPCCGPRRVEDEKLWFGFAMTRGVRNIYLRVVRQHPIVSMIVWSVLFLCETTMVAIYLWQVSGVAEGATWNSFTEEELGLCFCISSALSILLLSQLIFAYSFTPFTIVVVLVTTIYQIVLLFMALVFGLTWASRMYVPMFLRCWPMRQYFLFLLDSVAMLSSSSDRLDVVRLAAPSLSLFLTMVFTTACIFQIQQIFSGTMIGTIDSLYFVMATVSTTGFGDVLPQGNIGRMLTIGIIFVFLAKMPSWIVVVVGMVKMLRDFPKYGGPPHHFIVYGHVSQEDAVSILDEVFKLYPTRSVCFCNASFPRDVLSLGGHPNYRMRSTFMVVKVLNKASLHRMRVSEADAVIISPTSDGTAKARDDDVFLSSVTFQRHAPFVQQYLQLRFGTHIKLLEERETMVDQNMRSIMASALILPGIVPFLVNLVRTASSGGSSPASLWSEEGMDNWKDLYEYSRRATFRTFTVPPYFERRPLRDAVYLLKTFNVLVVGVEEGRNRMMILDLDYKLALSDTILVLHESGSDSVDLALRALDPTEGSCGSMTGCDRSEQWEARMASPAADASAQSGSRGDVPDAEVEELGAVGIDSASLIYPFNPSFEVPTGSNEEVPCLGTECDNSPGKTSPVAMQGHKGKANVSLPNSVALPKGTITSVLDMQVERLRRRLLGEDFVVKCFGDVSLSRLPLGGSLAVLTHLLNWRQAVRSRSEPVESSVERIERQINDILRHVSNEYQCGRSGKAPGENFLFIDHVSSFKQPLLESMYDHYLNDHASRFELVQMMRCIRGIHSRSRVTLLSWQSLSDSFLRQWDSSFEFPLRHIRGSSTMESHLNYAIKESGGAANLRGILIYCSQLSHWDFKDVPLVAVENNIRAILDCHATSEKQQQGVGGGSSRGAEVEQQVMVELKSFKSCISVTPHHADTEWRQRGEVHFQYSLAFMMGRCFSANMLQTIFIHAHRNRCIMKFLNNVLCLHRQGSVFDTGGWNSGDKSDTTLFKVCGNQLLHFQTFGDLFVFLLKHRSWVAIGVFRRFPTSEGLPGVPRYFITNPPMKMPLRVDDVVYALSGVTGAHNRMGC